MRNKPALSVLIPAWRAAAFIGVAIGALKAQAMGDFEALIVDDGSPDDTLAAATAAIGDDPRFIVIRQEKNAGAAAARNVGLARAEGRWIAVLDSDDSMRSDRFAVMLAAAERLSADIVCDNPVVCADLSRPEAGKAMLPIRPGGPETPISLASFVLGNVPSAGQRALGYTKPLFRNAFVRETGARYDEAIQISEDFTFFADLLAHGAKAFQLSHRGYLYWVRDGSISRRPASTDFVRMMTADQEFRDRHGPRLSQEAIAALDVRMNELKDIHVYTRFVEGVRGRNRQKAAAILRRPLALRFAGATLQLRLKALLGRNRFTPMSGPN